MERAAAAGGRRRREQRPRAGKMSSARAEPGRARGRPKGERKGPRTSQYPSVPRRYPPNTLRYHPGTLRYGSGTSRDAPRYHPVSSQPVPLGLPWYLPVPTRYSSVPDRYPPLPYPPVSTPGDKPGVLGDLARCARVGSAPGAGSLFRPSPLVPAAAAEPRGTVPPGNWSHPEASASVPREPQPAPEMLPGPPVPGPCLASRNPGPREERRGRGQPGTRGARRAHGGIRGGGPGAGAVAASSRCPLPRCGPASRWRPPPTGFRDITPAR